MGHSPPVYDGAGKGLGLLFGQAQNKKGQPLGGLAADARQTGELLYQSFQGGGEVFHGGFSFLVPAGDGGFLVSLGCAPRGRDGGFALWDPAPGWAISPTAGGFQEDTVGAAALGGPPPRPPVLSADRLCLLIRQRGEAHQLI